MLGPQVIVSLEHARQSIAIAFSEYQAQMALDVKSALEKALNTTNVEQLVESECHAVIEREVKDSVRYALHGLAWNLSLRNTLTPAILRQLADEIEKREATP